MHDRWLQNLPDELPEDVMAKEDLDFAIAIRERHATLKRIDNENLRRKQQLFEQYGLMFKGQHDTEMRLNLLIEMFVGRLSVERLDFEIRWVTLVKDGMEFAYADFLEQQRQQREGKTLHLPGIGEHKIPAPPKESDNGTG